MAQKPEIQFDKLYQKLYNPELWLLAYQQIAPKPGNMTEGMDGKTIDGAGMQLIMDMIGDLKASRYVPKPVRRVYIPKASGKLRPLGIPCFQDKLLQMVVKLILEAIYEPTFSEASHGFRPQRSCHTALETVKRMIGVRWWIEGDIKGFFDHLEHRTLLSILSQRITDKRFLHLIEQFLRAGYVEDWHYHKTYSGAPQGGNLSPLLSNIYLNELDQIMATKVAEFNKGEARKVTREYATICKQLVRAKKVARQTGDWTVYKALKKRQLKTTAKDPQDPNYRRMYFVRYADDWLVGINGSKADATEMKAWLTTYLRDELKLELSAEKTLITHASNKVRFLGYDIVRWKGTRIRRTRTKIGMRTRRATEYQLALLLPHDKSVSFAKKYGEPQKWRGTHRKLLLSLSELEILMIYNAEIRGFLGYYALADNLKLVAPSLLWLTTSSFLRTLANKRRSSLKKVAQSLKRGPNQYVVTLSEEGKPIKEYELVSSTRQLMKEKVTRRDPDLLPNTHPYTSRTELGKRLLAHTCEWCGTSRGQMEVHHVRKLGNLKGKEAWERQMIERRRKTMILCVECHDELHAGKLSEKKRSRKTGELATRKRVRLVRGERSETYSSHGVRRTALTLLLCILPESQSYLLS
ncbi:group II intron reverse transcriptase/maturase [Ktedonosporobacter rubrisoli]|uniref:Group II intron reverse transcriptase/maturase n=2 Tax=Ktedonosporobacter rubrisoli TaxID=2509675 RepID=A0A4P6K708_KTERU|nr:group II intron reverse transcriptase/maturase [Ktedonosporobacter rubrisoli]